MLPPLLNSGAGVIDGPDDSALNQFAHALGDLLWKRLPFSATTAEQFTDSAHVVDYYDESRRILNRHYGDLQEMFRAIGEINLVLHQKSHLIDPADLLAIEKWVFPPLPTDKVLKAELVAQSTGIVHPELYASLRAETFDLAFRFFDWLIQLVSAKIAGLIEWHGATVCRLRFSGEPKKNLSAKTPRAAWSGQKEQAGFWFNRAAEAELLREATNVQELMRAVRHPVSSRQYPMPDPLQYVVERVPEWIAPLMVVVTGDCFRNEAGANVDTFVGPLAIPALVLGSIVLVGGVKAVDEVRLLRDFRGSSSSRLLEHRGTANLDWLLLASPQKGPAALTYSSASGGVPRTNGVLVRVAEGNSPAGHQATRKNQDAKSHAALFLVGFMVLGTVALGLFSQVYQNGILFFSLGMASSIFAVGFLLLAVVSEPGSAFERQRSLVCFSTLATLTGLGLGLSLILSYSLWVLVCGGVLLLIAGLAWFAFVVHLVDGD